MPKRFILLGILLFFLKTSFYCEIVNFFTNKMAWKIENGINLENGSDFEPITESLDLLSELNMKELNVTTGIKLNSESLDFTTSAIYYPTFFSCLNLGIGSIFHTNYTKKNFFEMDNLIGLFIKYNLKEKIIISSNIMYMYKVSMILINDNNDFIKLKNNNLAIGFSIEYVPISRLSFLFSVSSYSYYRYMLFFAPDFRLTTSYLISNMFEIGTEAEIQYIDMFTLSANFNSATIRCFVRVKF